MNCNLFTSVLYDFYDRPHLIIYLFLTITLKEAASGLAMESADSAPTATVSVELTDQLEPQVDKVQGMSAKNADNVCEIHHQLFINFNNSEFYIHRHTLLQLTESSYLQWLQ